MRRPASRSRSISHASFTSRPASITSIVGTIRSGRHPPAASAAVSHRWRCTVRCPASTPIGAGPARDQPGQRLVVGLLHHDQVQRAIRGQGRRHLGVAPVGDQHNAVGLDHGARRRAVKAGEPGDVGRCGHDQPRDAGLGHELAGSNGAGPAAAGGQARRARSASNAIEELLQTPNHDRGLAIARRWRSPRQAGSARAPLRARQSRAPAPRLPAQATARGDTWRARRRRSRAARESRRCL